jgi:hypothetical protein
MLKKAKTVIMKLAEPSRGISVKLQIQQTTVMGAKERYTKMTM